MGFRRLPIVAAGNCCCLWVVGGGVIAAYLFQQNHSAPITPGDGALVGLFAGLIGAFVQFLVAIPVSILVGPMEREVLRRILEGAGSMPPQMRDAFDRYSTADRQFGGAGLMIVRRIFLLMIALCTSAPVFLDHRPARRDDLPQGDAARLRRRPALVERRAADSHRCVSADHFSPAQGCAAIAHAAPIEIVGQVSPGAGCHVHLVLGAAPGAFAQAAPVLLVGSAADAAGGGKLDERNSADLDTRSFTLTFAQPVAVRDLLLLLVRGTSLSVPIPALTGCSSAS